MKMINWQENKIWVKNYPLYYSARPYQTIKKILKKMLQKIYNTAAIRFRTKNLNKRTIKTPNSLKTERNIQLNQTI